MVITDQQIGHILASAPADTEDGAWPAKPVRDVIEELAAKEIEKGIAVSRFNQRGGIFEGPVRRRNPRARIGESISDLGGGRKQLAAHKRVTTANRERLGLSCTARGHGSRAGPTTRRLKRSLFGFCSRGNFQNTFSSSQPSGSRFPSHGPADGCPDHESSTRIPPGESSAPTSSFRFEGTTAKWSPPGDDTAASTRDRPSKTREMSSTSLTQSSCLSDFLWKTVWRIQ